MKLPEHLRAKDITITGMELHAFIVPFRGTKLRVLAYAYANGWEQVVVSLKSRTPTWDEMCHIKNLFWGEDDCCIQFHPRKENYVNIAEHALHIWKPPIDLQAQLEEITK